MRDLRDDARTRDETALRQINDLKTGALFVATVRGGGLLGGGDSQDLARLSIFGEAIGFAFQLCDDLLDVCSTVDAVGKDVGQDDDTTTFVDLWGECRTRAAVRQSLAKAVEAVGHDSPWPSTFWTYSSRPNLGSDVAPALSLSGVDAGYDGRSVLSDFSLSIAVGEVYALLGANGAGKSTVARVASGLLPARRGRVVLGKGGGPRGRIGLAPQDSALFPALSPRENVDVTARLCGVPKRDRGRRCEPRARPDRLRPARGPAGAHPVRRLETASQPQRRPGRATAPADRRRTD